MLKAFGAWTPDLPPHAHDGLVTATNVYAGPLGYHPVHTFVALTDPLPDAWRGGGTFVGADGSVALLAGTDEELYEYSGGTWTSKIDSLTTTNPWRFAQFGDLVIGTNGGAPIKYDIAAGTAANLGGSPPNSKFIAIVKDFVFVAGDSGANSTVYWSGINNAEQWTVGSNQSDYQQIPDGGAITGLAGGEYGLVFQRGAINRFSYVGSPIIFQRDKISDNIGCISSGSLAQAGRMVFFLSERGFYAFEDGGLKPIGENQINRTFFDFYEMADIETLMTSAIDPRRSLVMWAMPDRIWIYNWNLDRWSIIETNVVGVSTGFTSNKSLEDLDTLYPGGIDTIPFSLDDANWRGGSPFLTVINSDNEIGTFDGAGYLVATLEMNRIEFFPGRSARVRKMRLMSDATMGVTADLAYAQRLGEQLVDRTTTTMRDSGDMPIRVTGRYIAPKITFATDSDWNYAHSLDITANPGGNRG